MRDDPALTVVLCTWDRPKELDACLHSLASQRAGVEFVLRNEKGPLAALRNDGWRHARAGLVSFLDDDVVVAPGWVRGVLDAFQRPGVVGASGPSPVSPACRAARDLYRHPAMRKIYDALFVVSESRPGHLSGAGTFVPDPDWSYQGPVQFLEACNMSFRKDALEAVGGFDEAYGGIGDWSEPDLCFRLRRRFGDAGLHFDPKLAVEHRCATGGAMRFRVADAKQRYRNYCRFASRWVAPTWRSRLYRGFLWSYYYGWHGLQRLRPAP